MEYNGIYIYIYIYIYICIYIYNQLDMIFGCIWKWAVPPYRHGLHTAN